MMGYVRTRFTSGETIEPAGAAPWFFDSGADSLEFAYTGGLLRDDLSERLHAPGDLGAWLAENGREGGAMDVSDGVARYLHRLCRESGVGATLDAAALPFAPGFAKLAAALGADPLELALSGGEDYVLLFTLPSGVAPPDRFGCRAVGTIERSRRIALRREGRLRPLPAAGWDHLSS